MLAITASDAKGVQFLVLADRTQQPGDAAARVGHALEHSGGRRWYPATVRYTLKRAD